MKKTAVLVTYLLLQFSVCAMGDSRNVVVGVGAGAKCHDFVKLADDPSAKVLSQVYLSYAQGWFSALNSNAKPTMRSVGGTLTSDELFHFLALQCQAAPEIAYFTAVDALYERLGKAGL